MKNIFIKKAIWGIILIMLFGLISIGCVPTPYPPTPPTPPTPTTYTVKIVSAHVWCYGTVYVSGSPTSSILVAWGSTFVYNVLSGAPIWIKDTAGLQSNTRYFNPIFGNTIVFDTWP